MPDYAAISVADPGGTVEEAFAVLSAMTEVRSRGVYRQNYVSIANAVDFETATALENRVKTLVMAGSLPDWVDHALRGEGIDVNNPQTRAQLDAIVGGSFTSAMADNIKSTGHEAVLVFPGLKIGWVEQARAKAAG